MADEKACTKCGVVQPLAEFYKAVGGRDGRRGDCRSCMKVQRAERYDSAAAVERTTRWRRDNPERFAAWQREYRSRPERKRAMRDLYYRRTYGISADDADAILEAQGGGCAICGRCPDRLASLHLDHDHSTGAIRGFLCIDCNQGLGKLRDDPELLRRAADYVEQHRRP